MIKYYIASSLENASNAKKLMKRLNNAGWQLTYDWTKHGAIKDIAKLKKAARQEMQGVIDADIVIVLLPGARGTHTELGIALATNKKVFIYADDEKDLILTDRTCSFYYSKNVTIFTGDIKEFIKDLFKEVTIIF